MNLISTILSAFILCLFSSGYSYANQIHPVSGSYYTSEADLKVAARGIPMAWERTYRSNRTILKITGSPDNKSYEYIAPSDGPLGFGWHTPFTMRIIKNAAVVSDPAYNCDALVDADGRIIYFPKDAAGAVQPDYANGYTLGSSINGWTLTQRGGNRWTFDDSGKLQTISDPLNRTATLTYNRDGQLTGITDTASRTIYTLSWTNNHITTITDPSGRSISYSYDNGNLTGVKHASTSLSTGGETLFTYSYNGSHGLMTNKNSLNETWRITYRYPTNNGFAISLTDPNGNSSVQNLDSSGTTVTIKHPGGNIVTQTRNEDGQLTSEQDSSGARTITVGYLGGGARILTDADGNITKEYRDIWENVTRRIDPEGGITQYSYNTNGKPTSIIDAENSTTTITYDGTNSLPTHIIRAQGTADQTTTTFTYNNGDLQTTTTDGSTTTFSYNNAGLPTTITDPEGNITTLTYDAIGNLTTSTDASTPLSTGGNKTEYSYDWRGNLITAKDPEGNITTYSYNTAGRLQTVTDPKGNITTTTTDFAGRIISVTAPSGTTSFTYDPNGNLKTVNKVDAVTSYTYDTKNRLISTKDPENNTTTYAYANGGGSCSTCGNSTSNTTPTIITDPLNNVTSNTLDKLGRIKQISDPLNNLTNLVYDKVGRVTTRTDANGNGTTYQLRQAGQDQKPDRRRRWHHQLHL